ncbi:MAG TPA: sigma-70 family RNA polymerase sigma factor [Acidimicrobiales bacterium]|jgi:RNA polymerase sigma-70 factor (ECF subfamily)
MTFGPTFDSVLTAAQSGAPWALERIYTDLASSVAGYLRLQGAAEAEDLTSDVFVSVLRTVGGFSGNEDQFRSWVFTIAHHRLQDDRRRHARRPPFATGADEALAELPARLDEGVEDAVQRRISTERVRQLCERLAPDQRDVLLLRMVGGMSLEQTAEALGKSVGAVKALQHRSVGALRRLLERQAVSL